MGPERPYHTNGESGASPVGGTAVGARANELLRSAEELLRERRFGEAIEAFHLHLEEEPRDVKALLELGICHLLNGSRQAFHRIY